MARLESAVEENQMDLLSLILMRAEAVWLPRGKRGGCRWVQVGQVQQALGGHRGLDVANVLICINTMFLRQSAELRKNYSQ